MDDTRRMLAEVFAQDDLVKRDFGCWEAKRQQQQREQQECAQRQAAHVRYRYCRLHSRLYSFHPRSLWWAKPHRCHAWATQIAREQAYKAATEVNNQIVDDLDEFNAALNERFDRRRAHFEQRDNDLAARIDELERRLVELEQRVADLEGSGQQKIVPLLTFKGGRDAA